MVSKAVPGRREPRPGPTKRSMSGAHARATRRNAPFRAAALRRRYVKHVFYVGGFHIHLFTFIVNIV